MYLYRVKYHILYTSSVFAMQHPSAFSTCCLSHDFFWILLNFFKRSTFVGSAWSLGFFIPATTANDLRLWRISIPDLSHDECGSQPMSTEKTHTRWQLTKLRCFWAYYCNLKPGNKHTLHQKLIGICTHTLDEMTKVKHSLNYRNLHWDNWVWLSKSILVETTAFLLYIYRTEQTWTSNNLLKL